jgi:hypothetical protein
VNITLHTILVLENFQNSKDEPFSNIVGIVLHRGGGSKNKPFVTALITKSSLRMKKTERGKTTKICNQSIKYVLVCLNPFRWVHITRSIVSLSIEVSCRTAIWIDLASRFL